MAHQTADTPTLGLKRWKTLIPVVHTPDCLLPLPQLGCHVPLSCFQNQKPEQGPARLPLGKEGQGPEQREGSRRGALRPRPTRFSSTTM